MNDIKQMDQSASEMLPVPLEMLTNPLFAHRYHDERGNLLPVEEIIRVENIWAEVRKYPPTYRPRRHDTL